MLYAALGILAAALLLAVIKICRLRRSVREIRGGLREKLHGDTNTLITVSSRDRDVCALASELNTELQELREKRLKYELGSTEIKNAVTNISHDLRTPLTAICGHLELISRTDDPERIRRYLDVISERADSMKLLTEEMFRYSLVLSEEDESPEVSEVFVNQVLAECISGSYPALTARGITPVINITDERVVRLCSETDLARIFSNLLGNAVKYSDGDLEISLAEDGTVRFTNTAHGLTEVQVEKLFDRFYTVENARYSTGLGLSIARTLAERMSGTVHAEYKDDRLTVIVKI